MTHRSPAATDRLLTAARHEFARRGEAGARTDQIARRAGVNKQLIHYYFRTKAGLYRAVRVATAEAVATALAGLPLIGLTAVERLRRLVRGQFDFLLGQPEHAAVLLGATEGGDWADIAIRPVTELLREGQATGFFRDDIDPEGHARLGLLLTLGFFGARPVTERWGDAGLWRDRAADLIVRGASW
ncbi:MAG: TetR family transcriptional regulator [Gemmatimonadales bacterium]